MSIKDEGLSNFSSFLETLLETLSKELGLNKKTLVDKIKESLKIETTPIGDVKVVPARTPGICSKCSEETDIIRLNIYIYFNDKDGKPLENHWTVDFCDKCLQPADLPMLHYEISNDFETMYA